ncbi:MAG: magnesium/cobalt transporter CorA [Chitinophagales bacterium]|nr:magnesium/cobalt transporter CorA [Chitinophagales bacterium]
MKKRKKQSFRKRQSEKKRDQPPGKLIYVGDEKNESVKIQVIDFNEEAFEEKEFTDPKDCFAYKEKSTNTWINVTGIHEPEILRQIGEHFGISSLVLEDIMNTNARPKVDDDKNYLFIILKMIDFDEEKQMITNEQVSLVLGSNYVISFQENEKDLFDKIRERLKLDTTRLRALGTDYLAYSIMDKIIDNYFFIIEKMGDFLEDMEEEVSENPRNDFIQRLNELKQSNIYLRKSVWPLREVINFLLRGESKQIKTETLPYFRDLYDHTVQVIDTVETYRDLLSDIMDVYLSSISLKMNEVMKVLTIISTIFIPLTFIVGVYGMNFKFMPELGWKEGYYLIWGIMIVIAMSMIIYFKRKKWF